jgi:hypothetical protein
MAWKRTYSKARDALHLAQVAPVVIAQRQDGAPGAKHLLPEMWERMHRSELQKTEL